MNTGHNTNTEHSTKRRVWVGVAFAALVLGLIASVSINVAALTAPKETPAPTAAEHPTMAERIAEKKRQAQETRRDDGSRPSDPLFWSHLACFADGGRYGDRLHESDSGWCRYEGDLADSGAYVKYRFACELMDGGSPRFVLDGGDFGRHTATCVIEYDDQRKRIPQETTERGEPDPEFTDARHGCEAVGGRWEVRQSNLPHYAECHVDNASPSDPFLFAAHWEGCLADGGRWDEAMFWNIETESLTRFGMCGLV